ncbi:MAG: hypothetical protein MJ222_02900 [Bacilli bacterium]|nr:hypothetical protein [Bacilli bacterium]
MMDLTINSYNSKVDSKNRITLRKARFDYYNVQEFEDGKIVLEPRVLVPPFEVSKKTLNMMDKSVKNIKKNKVSDPIK